MNNQDETKQQRIEELAEFRQRVAESEVFRSLFRDSVVGTIIVTPNGSVVQANKAFCDFLGYSETELVGQNVLSITYPEDREASSTAIRQISETMTRIQSLEKRYLHKSGQVLWGEVSSTLIFDVEGKPSYFIAQVLDISERKRNEEALKKAYNELEERVKERNAELRDANERLQQSHDEIKTIHDRMVDGLLITDIETLQFIRTNASMCRMLGYSETELLSMSVRDLHPAEALPFILESISSVEEVEQTPTGNIPVLRKDGSVFYAEIIGKFLIYNGRPCVMGIFRDVTERKQAEEALQQSHDELQSIYDQAVDGIIIVDAATKNPIRTNTAFCRMLGYSENEVNTITPEQVHRPEMLPVVREHLEAVKRGCVHRIDDLPFVCKDGKTVYADVISSPILYNKRPGWISFIHEVTERKLAQEALERERQSLWRMLQASDHERQIISYEIHDGLAQCLAAAVMQFQAHDSLRENLPDKAKKAYETAVELVHQAHSEARRLISEVRPPIIDEIGLETAISHLVHEQRRQGGPKIECNSSVQFGRLPPTFENALYRIVQEALTNACKHSKSMKVTVTLTQVGQDVRLEVRDWGIGFDPEVVGKGHFGLESIRQRVRLLGGRLTIESTLGSGTLVQVVVPILEKQNDG